MRSEKHITRQCDETRFLSRGAVAERPHRPSSLLGVASCGQHLSTPSSPTTHPVPSASPGSAPGRSLQSYWFPSEGRCSERRDLSPCSGFCANWHFGRKRVMNLQVKERERGRKEGKESLLPSQLSLPQTLVYACDGINLYQKAEASSNLYECVCVCLCV